MSGLLSVLLVTSAALLFIANGQSNYDMLREVDKKHVDMAIRYANKNSEIQKNNPKEHLNFFKVVGQSEISAREFKINLLLKATDCPKASRDSEHKHRPECHFKSRRPCINCVVCTKDFHGSTDPYIDCVLNTDVKKVICLKTCRTQKYFYFKNTHFVQF
uniref:Cystatin domain-containing protein n=1 Tax=Oncorhynchus kisutch TaxID=8019 RepID=A0A8C7N4J8_ONCKI